MKQRKVYLLGLEEISDSYIKQIAKELSCQIKRTDTIPENADFIIVDLNYIGENIIFEINKRKIPFVIITEYNEGKIQDFLQKGAVDFIIKDKEEKYIKLLPSSLKHIFTHLGFIEQVNENRQLLSKLEQQALFGIYIFGKDLKFRYVNPGFLNILGYLPDEIYKKDILSIVHPDDREKVIKKIRERFEGKKQIAEFPFRFIDKNGNTKWVYARGFVTILNSEKVIMGTLSDITDLRKFQEEIKKEKEEIEQTLKEGVYAISKIVEIKDPYTFAHQVRVAEIANMVGKKLKFNETQLKELLWAGLLHDIGKIAIPSEILLKPSKLNETEYSIIKQHPLTGHKIVKEIHKAEKVALIILQHHERLDGSGYPEGLKDGKIILESRLLAIVDVVEAMMSNRPYRTARTKEEILDELVKGKGEKYDPLIVDIIIELLNEGEIRIGSND